MPLYRYIGGTNTKVIPAPMMNIVKGGIARDNQCRFSGVYDFPDSGLPHFPEALRSGAEVFHTLKGVLKKRGYNTAVGDEGGFAPNLKSNDEAIEVILVKQSQKAGYKPGNRLHRTRSGSK